MKKGILFFCTVSLFVSCQNNELSETTTGELVTPEIEISLPVNVEKAQTRANTLNPVTAWENGDKIGMYAVDQGTVKTYRGAKPNLAYQYLKTEHKWEFDTTADPAKDKQLFLHSGNAVLYAFSPLNKNAEDLTAVPLKFNTNVDYLYGTHRVAPFYVNNQQTTIRLEMLHAQAFVGVRLKRSVDRPYNQDGIITSMKITGNTPSSLEAAYVRGNYPTTGTLNLSTGEINSASASRSDIIVAGFDSGVTIPELVGATANTTGIYYAMIAPEKENVRKAFQLVLDGKTHFVPVNDCEWKPGFKYIYTLTITGKGIDTGDDVNPDDPNDHSGDALIIRPWASGVDESHDF